MRNSDSDKSFKRYVSQLSQKQYMIIKVKTISTLHPKMDKYNKKDNQQVQIQQLFLFKTFGSPSTTTRTA